MTAAASGPDREGGVAGADAGTSMVQDMAERYGPLRGRASQLRPGGAVQSSSGRTATIRLGLIESCVM